MSGALLDVNVLVAISWPQRIHHGAVRAWFAREAPRGWATSPVTESGFIRVSSNPKAIDDARTPVEAAEFLGALQSVGAWSFWSDDVQLTSGTQGVRSFRQVTDAHLLQLAHDRGGAVATFDVGLLRLAEERGQSAVLIDASV